MNPSMVLSSEDDGDAVVPVVDEAVAVQPSSSERQYVRLSQIIATPVAPERTGLSYVRITRAKSYLVPFTEDCTEVHVHYVDDPDIASYVLCCGTGCVLCEIGQPAESRLLLPVFDCLAGAVAVLTMSRSLRPRALAPQVFDVLKTVQGGRPQVMAVAHTEDGKMYSVEALDLPVDVDNGAEAIQRFIRESESGRLKLESVFLSLSNAALRTLPRVQQALRIRGLV